MSRVIAYVDGFNLYFGLRGKGWRRYYWLDLIQLPQVLLKPRQQLEAVHYFTSRIRANGHNAADMRRQNTYLEALSTFPGITIHLGHYLDKPRQCRACGARWMDYEEKMSVLRFASAFECVGNSSFSFHPRHDCASAAVMANILGSARVT